MNRIDLTSLVAAIVFSVTEYECNGTGIAWAMDRAEEIVDEAIRRDRQRDEKGSDQ